MQFDDKLPGMNASRLSYAAILPETCTSCWQFLWQFFGFSPTLRHRPTFKLKEIMKYIVACIYVLTLASSRCQSVKFLLTFITFKPHDTNFTHALPVSRVAPWIHWSIHIALTWNAFEFSDGGFCKTAFTFVTLLTRKSFTTRALSCFRIAYVAAGSH